MKYPSHQFHAAHGLTLIEVLIAAAILATAIMSVFVIYSQCLVEIRRAKNRTLATNFTQMMMEMIVSSPHLPSTYHGFSTAEDPPADNPVENDLNVWKAALRTFPTLAVGSVEVTTEAYTYVVLVQIEYQDYGRTGTNTLSLHITRHF